MSLMNTKPEFFMSTQSMSAQSANKQAISNKRPNLLQVIGSVTWAFLGIQSSRNRERDFTYGNPWQFIVVAFLLTGVVALIFFGMVKLTLHLAGVS